MEKNLSFLTHVRLIVEETGRVVNSLQRLYPGVRGSTDGNRRLLESGAT